MTTSRDAILKRLRAAQQPFGDLAPTRDHLPMVPMPDTSTRVLVDRFIEQAEKLRSVVHRPASEKAAIKVMLDIVAGDPKVLCWAFEHIPLSGLADALSKNQIKIADPRDPSVRVGITGVDAALAATGSLVLQAGEGKHRVTSLLPPVHVVVVHQSQIMADLEAWVASQRTRGIDAFRQTASVILISGPSRTADIAMQLVMGMHGPAELHIVAVDMASDSC